MPKNPSKLDKIIKETSIEIEIDEKEIRNALKWTFKQIAMTILLRRKSVMIRGFMKFVLAKRKKVNIKENFSNYETRKK